MTRAMVVLRGDQTGDELLQEALRVIAADVIGVSVELITCDLSLEARRRSANAVVFEAAAAIRAHGLGLKAATITPEGADDVGSPNAILREELDATVILRTGRRLPGVRPIGGVHAPISVVRMAVGDAYRAREWREGSGLDETAYRADRITRRVCRTVAEFAFRHAERVGARVFGGPKFTVSRIYEGMFKDELDAAALRHPEVAYQPLLIDALYAALLSTSGEPLVIPALNRDGDCLSDLVLQMFGSLAGSESLILGFHDDWSVRVVMSEAPHGTAPRLQGKNVANPLAMILAAAALLDYQDDAAMAEAAAAIRAASVGALDAGVRTADLHGHATATEFTDEVIRRTRVLLGS